jgi:RNA binding exosome subunit
VLKEQTAIGFREKKIKIFEIRLEKQRHLKQFLEFLVGSLSDEQKGLILRQRESRLDEELDFFIRLDKQRWLSGEIFITDSGDCFHIKMSIAAFPAKREAAMRIIDKIFK